MRLRKEDNMTEKVLGTIALFIGGTLLTIARRWKNKDKDAGLGIAGWTMFIIICIWL